MQNSRVIKVSAVVPMYNAERTIADCLNSLVQQEFPLTQIICVDDASTDRTLAIAREFEQSHPGLFQIIAFTENKGGAHARNAGIRLLQCDYVQLLDADDFLLPEKIKHQVELLQKLDSEPGFIAAALKRRNLSGTDREINVKSGNPFLALLTIGLGCTCSNLWSLKALNSIGGFNVAMKSSQEFVLMADLLKAGATVVLDTIPLTIVRDQLPGKSVSQKNPAINMEQFVRLRCDLYLWLREQNKIAADEQQKFKQAIFDAIRLFYRFNPAKAKSFHDEFVGKGFVPAESQMTSSGYIRLYRLFGFGPSERIRRLLSH